jgi:hypothetical protein
LRDVNPKEGVKERTKPPLNRNGRRGPLFLKKAHSAMKNHAINIVRALKANTITSRLNLRIRLSYACTQLISSSLTGIHLGAPIHPWAFTYCFYQMEKPNTAAKVFLA